MAGQVIEDSTQLFADASNTTTRTQSTYATLMRQSKKLGHTATLTIGEARESARQFFGPRTKRPTVDSDEVMELKKMVARSREVLANAKTVLPFLFPHEIILDRTKVTIIKRNFFWSSDVISIRIEDILNVAIGVGPLFGQVTVASRVMSSVDHFKIDHFWRKDAIEVKQVIQGYLIARQNKLQTDHLDHDELISTLHELGREG